MFRVLLIDLSYFFRTKWLIGTLIALNISDMFVAGLVYTNMMNFDYFVFFVPGVIVAGMFAAALDVGRRVHLGLAQGVSQYYLSLPLSLDEVVWAHMLSAGLGGTIYGSILMVVALVAIPKLASLATLSIIPLMFVVSMGLGGVAAIINLFSQGGDRYWVFAEGVQLFTLGLSTVFYPISVIGTVFPSGVTQGILLNPLSEIADSLRQVISTGSFLSAESFAIVVGTSLLLMVIGFVCYRHVFSKVWEIGKL